MDFLTTIFKLEMGRLKRGSQESWLFTLISTVSFVHFPKFHLLCFTIWVCDNQKKKKIFWASAHLPYCGKKSIIVACSQHWLLSTPLIFIFYSYIILWFIQDQMPNMSQELSRVLAIQCHKNNHLSESELLRELFSATIFITFPPQPVLVPMT